MHNSWLYQKLRVSQPCLYIAYRHVRDRNTHQKKHVAPSNSPAVSSHVEHDANIYETEEQQDRPVVKAMRQHDIEQELFRVVCTVSFEALFNTMYLVANSTKEIVVVEPFKSVERGYPSELHMLRLKRTLEGLFMS